MINDWRKLKLKFRLVGLQLSRLTLDKVYPRDPNPEHWRTINGSKVHLTNGKIDGGAGGKFSGNTWTGTRKGGMRGSTALPKYIGPKTAAESGRVPYWMAPSKEQMPKIGKAAKALSDLSKEYIVPYDMQMQINSRIKGMYEGMYSPMSGYALARSLRKRLEKSGTSQRPNIQGTASKASMNPGRNAIMKPVAAASAEFNFPDVFTGKRENANTQKIISYIHSLKQVDPLALSIYSNLGKLQKAKKDVAVSHEASGWFCAHAASGISMEINYPKMPKDDAPDNLKAKRVQTFLHENMHMADFCAGKGTGFYSAQHAGLVDAIERAKQTPYPGKEMYDYLKDVTARHSNLVSKAREKATQDIKEEIDGISGKYYSGEIGWYEFTKSVKSLERKRTSLTKMYQAGGLDGEDGRWGALCDLYDALSDGRVYTQNALNLKAISGHGRKYYMSDHNNAALEMTANWAVLRMQAPKLANLFARDKPEVAKQLDQVIADIAEVGKNAG